MAVVTFWGSGREQTGKTLSVVAVATNMAIEHNKRILVISTGYNNETIKHCFWSEQNVKRNSIFRPKSGVEVDNGIDGLAKMIQSNKVSPNLITDYTKVIFKDRLEILLGFNNADEYTNQEISEIYSDIVNLAGKYYDMVLVDLDNQINENGTKKILQSSDIIVASTSQKIVSFNAMIEKTQGIPKNKIIYLIGKYDRKSKYSIKNLSREMGIKKDVLAIPYNTLYFEAAEEANVIDLFLRLRRLDDKNDENTFFIELVKQLTNTILQKIQEAEMMR